MNEELGSNSIDSNSPIWGGNGCDYFSLTAEVNSYWTQFYQNLLNLNEEYFKYVKINPPKGKYEIEKHNNLMEELYDGIFDNTQLKTEKYFKKLWEDIGKVGFRKEDANQCIETCDTLINEEIEWWKDRKDLKKYKALKVLDLVEYYSWDVIWRLCKYHNLIAHPLHNYASKTRISLKGKQPQNTPIVGLSLRLNLHQLGNLYEGLKNLDVFASEHQNGQFMRALNGSLHKSIIEPMTFKQQGVLALLIMFLRDYQFFNGGDPQYIKWQQFFGINGGYARKLVSDFGKLQRLGPDAKTHRSLPEDYNKLKSLFESLV